MDDSLWLYRDDDVVVVNKPSGVIVHRGWAQDDNDLMRTVRDALGRYVYPVHRLDRGASGAVVFALTAAAARALGEELAAGRAHRRYVALVRGHAPESVMVDHALAPEPGAAAVPARTRIERLATWERYSLVAAAPETGRLHQIRRHLKHLSCPIIGDVKYGKGEHNRFFRERYGLHRLALHAGALGFEHPRTRAPVEVIAPVEGSLSNCFQALGLWEALEARFGARARPASTHSGAPE